MTSGGAARADCTAGVRRDGTSSAGRPADNRSVQPAIYIMTNKWNRVLYTGVTADLRNRLRVHRARLNPRGFTTRYNVSKLVYYELHRTMLAAIAREKQIKGGSRADKLRLIARAAAPRTTLSPPPSRRAPTAPGTYPSPPCRWRR